MKSCVALAGGVVRCGCGKNGGGLQAHEGTELYLLQDQSHLEGKSNITFGKTMTFSPNVVILIRLVTSMRPYRTCNSFIL